MQESTYFDNQIIKVQNLEFQRDSTDKNLIDNFFTFTSQTGGIVTGLTLTGSGSSMLGVSAGVAYDNSGERMQAYSGITFTPASGSNTVFATLAISDFNPDPTTPPPYASFPLYGQAQVNINPVTGSGINVSAFNTMVISQTSGTNSIPLGQVTYNGAIITNINVSDTYRQNLKLLGILDVPNTTINGAIITSETINSNLFTNPLTYDIFIASGVGIFPVQSGQSQLGSTSFPFLEIDTKTLNVTTISGLSPINFNSDLSISSTSRIFSQGTSLVINPSGQDTYIGNRAYAATTGTLFVNNISAWENVVPAGPFMNISAGLLTLNLSSIFGGKALQVNSAGDGTYFQGGINFSVSNVSNIILDSTNIILSGTTILASGVDITCATSGTNDIGTPSNPIGNIYADSLTNSLVQASPPGIISAYGGVNAPAGWLICNGAAVSRTTYANLFSAVASNFGNGDGVNTFNIPNLYGYFLRGLPNYPSTAGTGSVSGNKAIFNSHPYQATGTKVIMSSGALSGLTLNVPYYVIVVDSDTLSFATTRANALAGIVIAITGANTAVIDQYEDPDSSSRQANTPNGNTGLAVGSFEDENFLSHLHDGTFSPNTNHAGTNSGNDTPQSPYLYNKNTSPTGGNETRPKNIYVNYIIKT